MNQKTSTLKIEELLSFPKDGDIVSGVKVSSAKCKVKNGKLSYRICLPKGTRRADVPNILKAFYTTGLVVVDGVDTVVQDHNYRIKPTRSQTIVTGSASVIPLSLTNPGMKQLTALEDFDQEYSKMEMAEPGTYFRVFPYRGFDGPAFRTKLFSFVSKMGENYGYCDDKKLFHRRASLVMPKIKITKAPPNAKMFYHTHPKRDEPSLSSADDYLVYFDMSHKPLNIRHFYTVMADRMDYFHVVPKHSKKKDYVKINEDKFIEEVDNQIDEAGKRLDEKLPSDTYEDNLYYCERVTREVVKFLNKKYAKYFTITYKCHYRVKKNPDKPTGSDLHLDDEFIAKALNDIKSGKYSWPEFNNKTQPQEEYAYWHSRYFSLNRDARGVGYTGLMPGDMRRLDVFLYDQYRGSNYTYDDILGILCLSYDIRVRDSKIRDVKSEDSRINDILDFLEITDKVIRDDIKLMDSIVSTAPYGELSEAIGTHRFIIPLADFSMKSIEAMKDVRKGKKNLDMAKYEINVKLKERMAKAVAESLGEASEDVRKTEYGEQDPETGESTIIKEPRTVPVFGLDGLVQQDRVNPPIEVKKIDYKAFLPLEIFDNPELLKEIFEKYKKEGKDVLTVKNQYNIAVPVKDTAVGMMISISSGYVEFTYPTKGYTATIPAEEAVVSAFRNLIEVLNDRGFEIRTDDIAIGTAEPIRNPNDGMIISISGPVQPTKTKMLKSLEKRLDGEIVRTYTTRALKEYEKRSNLVEVSDEVFAKMSNNGDLVVVTNSLDGSRRGYLRKDFLKSKYLLLDSKVSDLPFLLRTEPGLMSFYLQPTNSQAEIKKVMMESVSPQEAKRVAELATDKDHDVGVEVDYMIQYDIEKPGEALEEVFQSIPKKNPNSEGSIFFPGNGSNYYLTAKTIPITALQGNPSHNSCPAVTQNLEMNTRNRNSAIQADYIQYGPLNLSDQEYWVRAAEHWKTTPEVAMGSNCSNCVAFDISPRMLECMPGSVQDDGQLGMCWMHNFKCHSARTCYTWAAGGPITEDSVSYDWQERSSKPKENPRTVGIVEKAIKSIKKSNLLGNGGFGTVFSIPNTDYVFKIYRSVDPDYYSELRNWIANKGPKPTYPEHLQTGYRMKWEEKLDIGLPLYAIGEYVEDSYPSVYNIVMEEIKGYTIAAKLYGTRGSRRNEKIKKINESLNEHLVNLAKIHQSEYDRFCRDYKEGVRLGMWADAHNGNMILDPTNKRIVWIDFFWEKDERGFQPRQAARGIPIDAFEDLAGVGSWVDINRGIHRSISSLGKKKTTTPKKVLSRLIKTKAEIKEAINLQKENIKLLKKVKSKFSKAMSKSKLNWRGTSRWRVFIEDKSYDDIFEDSLIIPYALKHYMKHDKLPEFKEDVPTRIVPLEELEVGYMPNPKKKIQIRIQESTNPEKKLMAIFTKPNGRTKTVHFGARGMSDYTQHKDPKRQKNYLARHGKMGEDWNNPTTAGALSRWILWGKPSLRESFNDFKKRFNLEGVMAVTNTKMNPSYTTKFDFVPGKEYTFDELPGHETGRMVTALEEEYGPLGTSLREDALHHFRSKGMEGGYGFPGTAQEAIYKAVIIPNEELVERFGHLQGKPKLQKHIEKYGLDYPSIGNEGNNRRIAMAKLGRDMPHLEVVPAKMNPRIPKKYEGQDPSEHSDLYTDEDPEGTIQGLGFKDAETAKKSIQLIKKSGKTHAHKIQAAMAMEQRARFHPHATKGIKDAQKIYAAFIEEMKEKTKRNPSHCPVEVEARRAANDPSFKHHKWYVKHHLDYVMAIAKAIVKSNEPEDQQLIHDMVWMHDYPKMLGDKDNFELVREFMYKHRSERYTNRLMNQLRWMEEIKSPDWSGRTTTIAAVMSVADALAHYYGPFFQIYIDENPDMSMEEIKKSNRQKLAKDKLKLRAGPMKDGLDSIKFQYKGRKVRILGNEHIKALIEKKNPSKTPEGRKIPKKYLKGLNKEEMAIAAKEIDKGYKYDVDDPKAYEYWKSDIQATARGYKTVPSKYKKKFIQMYGPLPEEGKFLDKMAKATKIKKSILEKVYDKGLAAWRGGHRPGVQQHQWAAGRVYSFVTLGNTVKKGNKKMPDYSLAIKAGLVKENPSWRHGEFAEDDPFSDQDWEEDSSQ